MSIDVAKSITRNTAILMGSQIITWVSSLILMLFLPRYLGSVEYGRLYLATSIVSIFSMVIDFGGRYSITKEVSRSRDMTPYIVVDSITMRIVLWILSAIALVVFSYIANYPSATKALLLILGIGMLWEGGKNLLWSCYQGFEDMKYPSLGGIVDRVFVTAVGVSALLMNANTIVIGIIMMIGGMLNFLVCARAVRRIVPFFPKFDWSRATKILKTGLPYFLWSIFGMIYYRIDAVMLSLMTPQAVVGWYGAAYRFFDILMFLPSLFSVAVFPVLSRLWKEEKTLALTTRKSLEFILLSGIPVSVVVFGFSEEIIQLFFGLNQYGPTILILKLFAVGLLLVYIDIVLGTAIIASDKQRQWSIVAFLAIIVNVLLNIFLIPYAQNHLGNGGIGAAISTIVTEFFVMTIALKLIPKQMLDGSRIAVTLKGLAAGALMIASIAILRTTGIPWMIQAVTSILMYAFALLGLRTFEAHELAFIRNALTVRNFRKAIMPEKGLQS